MEPNRNCNRIGQNRCCGSQVHSVKYTARPQNSGAVIKDTCSKSNEPVSRPVGMAYIPNQPFESLYDARCGLTEGTMFKDLNLIFCGVRGKQS